MIKTKLFELHLSKKVLFYEQKLNVDGYDFSKYLNGRFAAHLKKIRVLKNQIQIIAILDELNHTHLLEGLELQYVKFIQNLDCMNVFIDILKESNQRPQTTKDS